MEQTTTYPAVPVNQNGSGVATSDHQVFDLQGNRTWTKNQRGIIHRKQYDPVTGAIIRQVQDVDTTIETGVPTGWTTPAGAGRNLITDFEADLWGRTTQSLGPVHTADVAGTATSVRRAQWTVYDDVNQQTRSAAGFATGSNWTTLTLTNPVSIRIQDHRGQILQRIQATRASTAGRRTQRMLLQANVGCQVGIQGRR